LLSFYSNGLQYNELAIGMLDYKNRNDIEGKGKEFECERMLSTTNTATSGVNKAAGA
jgi:hypothetical protein